MKQIFAPGQDALAQVDWMSLDAPLFKYHNINLACLHALCPCFSLLRPEAYDGTFMGQHFFSSGRLGPGLLGTGVIGMYKSRHASVVAHTSALHPSVFLSTALFPIRCLLTRCLGTPKLPAATSGEHTVTTRGDESCQLQLMSTSLYHIAHTGILCGIACRRPRIRLVRFRPPQAC